MGDLFDKMRNDELINRAKEATEIGMYPYFRALSHSEGVTATLRREKGHDIDAACGQLRLKTERELEAASQRAAER